jgi:hypothetical protein
MPGKYSIYWKILDDRTSTPVVGRPYKLELASGPSYEDTTDVNGFTRVVYTNTRENVKLYVNQQTTLTIE